MPCFCTNCGTPIVETSAFCTKCGTKCGATVAVPLYVSVLKNPYACAWFRIIFAVLWLVFFFVAASNDSGADPLFMFLMYTIGLTGLYFGLRRRAILLGRTFKGWPWVLAIFLCVAAYHLVKWQGEWARNYSSHGGGEQHQAVLSQPPSANPQQQQPATAEIMLAPVSQVLKQFPPEFTVLDGQGDVKFKVEGRVVEEYGNPDISNLPNHDTITCSKKEMTCQRTVTTPSMETGDMTGILVNRYALWAVPIRVEAPTLKALEGPVTSNYRIASWSDLRSGGYQIETAKDSVGCGTVTLTINSFEHTVTDSNVQSCDKNIPSEFKGFMVDGNYNMVPEPKQQPDEQKTASSQLTSTQNTDSDLKARLLSIADILRRNDPKPDIPIPQQYWHDAGIVPTAAEKSETAKTLRLSNSQVPELLVEDLDPDVCGSSGCPLNIYGLRTTVAQDGGTVRQYKLLIEGHGGPDSFHILDTMTNGYRDLVVDGSYEVSVLKFDGQLYKETECFSHDFKTVDNLQPVKCP